MVAGGYYSPPSNPENPGAKKTGGRSRPPACLWLLYPLASQHTIKPVLISKEPLPR
ncbi:hypothetical protein LEP1GSC161_3934 [Leptospira santarosai str. CBC1416]|uniref:Uncharacterized protein n=2 Tax=Leptospira santarosai TaxID=28183 RepID=A0A0E2BFI3_9LEPT|nr:hypothetical protein LEP1GSC179_0030 [Leptospira santarosai str. MOR084]EMO56276.1 hypothetical protein LEP1GSC161_3934 [Leptospira santarosai str. CBC1416]EMO70340.1 hypothetical protein LEP1GSC130_0140 [Leptospira santarosai str. 200403458]EMO99220.1 hypothetical protein LEP1GSC120_1208 [Leptospira santarosai str. 200702252]